MTKKDSSKVRNLERIIGLCLPFTISIYAKWHAPTASEFVKGSLADILVPYGIYNFSASRGNSPLLSAAIPVAFYFTYETLQGLGCMSGTFDPWDYGAYTLGVALGFVTEKIVNNFRKENKATK